MERIVMMISPNNFPNGDAGAVRDLSFAKIYMQLGYTPIVICCNRDTINGEYDGVKYYSYHLQASTFFDKVSRYFEQKCLFIKQINEVETRYGIPSLIHLYGISNHLIKYIKHYAKKNKLQIIHDSVEWYSPCEFKYGKLDKAYIINNRLNTKIINKPIKVIAISSYLQDYFEMRGLVCERIPVIMDVHRIESKPCRDDKIKFIYAGSPANKDYLAEIVNAFSKLSTQERSRIEFNIYGVTEKQLYCIGVENTIDNHIVAHGRVSRSTVEKALQESDFSLLLRPENERYTKAGFPTKSVEAMANGTAMICNLTSDLCLYLQDGINSIIVEKCTADSLLTAIRKAINMNREEIDLMKNNAMDTAIEHFDYHSWVSTVKQLIER